MVQYNHLVFIALSCLVLSSALCRAVNGRSDASVRCFDREREALLQFKRGITYDTCGLLTSWMREADCCQWRGVRCSNHTGHVIALDIIDTEYWPCLQGKVSPSLGELKHLRRLNLSSNSFDSEIPYQLGNLSKLTTLDLSNSGLHGGESLQWLSRLTRLRYLDLSTNLSSATDWMQTVRSLSSLSVLRMNYCSLTDKTPMSVTYVNSSASLGYISLSGNYFNDSSIFRWLSNFPGITSRLVYLDLSDNYFYDSYIFRWLSNFPGITSRLVYLDLSDNYLEGPISIPDAFHRLWYLDLSQNNLEHSISSKVWNMPSLTHLFLYGNKFNGSVFQIVSKLCDLQQLDLAHNNFTDELTYVFQTALGCADKALITTLHLSNNRFFGCIPNTINSFSSLRELYLDGNNLNGTITQGIGQLAKLERLDISSNSFNGSLTFEHFLHLSSLQEFSSGGNPRLVVNISDDWFPPFQLDILSLESCKLGPYFPKWLLTQKSLSFLDLANAKISDTVPISFWNSLSPNLSYLNLSHNQISGVIPNLLKIFYELNAVDLSSNLLEGAVPSWVLGTSALYINDNRFSDASHILCPKTISSLAALDLSDNFFSEELPDCWKNMNGLVILRLGNNKFYGSIPKSIGHLNQLQYLDLHNNSFSGQLLASSLESLKSLVFLNLGYNSFTGHIPRWIGNAFWDLRELNLGRNMFHGELPPSLCHLSSLRILDISGNNVSGIIPKCIQNLTAMGKMIDDTVDINFGLGVESVDGIHQSVVAQRETTTVTWKRGEQTLKDTTILLFKSIDLSDNELTGEIPDGITRLTGLISLDFSGNKLTGNIPPEIGELSELEFLDFSNNQLTGHIPESLAKVAYLEIFDVSNNKLSGEIPLGTQLQSFDASSYTGNPGLCGAPLPECPGHHAPTDAHHGVDSIISQDEHDDDDGIFPGLYISMVFGLIVGFWGICGTLAVKRSLRWAYFRLLDDIYDRVYVITVLFVAKVWRKP